MSRLDLHLGYRHPLPGGSSLEAFIDVFNVLNQRTALRVDEAYTMDQVEPIVGGDREDLRHLKSLSGAPAERNPNFLRATAYQAPISGRVGLRFVF